MMFHKSLAGRDGLVLNFPAGDLSTTQVSSLKSLPKACGHDRSVCLLGIAINENSTGMGRIRRDGDGQFAAIFEKKDTTAEQKGNWR
jgi:bifunctional N-acetylglucosamine-1-phosphate-uridyltransferase/glucosamine-1-phosphate-acetyltransferase GlmU-like protein